MLSAISALNFQQSPIFSFVFLICLKFNSDKTDSTAGNINDNRTVDRVLPILFLMAKDVLNFLVFEDIGAK